MARVAKEYQVRKNEIMEAAQKLFYSKGYNEVSVNLIIDTIGISKGTFYHYFRSKEELLDQMIYRFSSTAIENILPIINNISMDAVTKLNEIYSRSSRFKLDQVQMMKTIINVLYDDNNIIMRYKLRKTSIKMFLPHFAKIIEQGVKEDLFSTGDYKKTAELILIMGYSLTDKTSVLLKESHNNPDAKEIPSGSDSLK